MVRQEKTTESLSVGELHEVGKFVQRDMMVTELDSKNMKHLDTHIIENGRSTLTCGTGDSFWTPKIKKFLKLLTWKRMHLQEDHEKFRCFKFISDEILTSGENVSFLFANKLNQIREGRRNEINRNRIRNCCFHEKNT